MSTGWIRLPKKYEGVIGKTLSTNLSTVFFYRNKNHSIGRKTTLLTITFRFNQFYFCCRQSDGPYSGHSSSNTLSSTASSGGHSDSDKWYEMGVGSGGGGGGSGGSGDQGETEPNGLGGGGYLQGASADSGIDTSSYGAPTHHSHPHSHHGSTTSLLAPGGGGGGRDARDRSVSPWHSPTEGGRRMLERSPAAAESPGPPAERSHDNTGRTPPTHLLLRDSSTYSLSEAGPHPRCVCRVLSTF